MSNTDTFKLLICQNDNTNPNPLEQVKHLIEEVKDDVDMIVLPECFNAPYGLDYFKEYAEGVTESSTYLFLSQLAKHKNAWVVGGSFIVKDGDKYYNRCYVFNRNGEVQGNYDKMHLFDIDLPEKKFKESAVLKPGTSTFTFDTEFGRFGIGICFDLRFPKLTQKYIDDKCDVICYPGAFTMPTGSAHYQNLLKARALDSQAYVIGAAPARNEEADYVTWSHSTVVDPWGDVTADLGHEVCTKVVTLYRKKISMVRSILPLTDSVEY